MGGDLHRHGADARVAHVTEECLELGRLGRRALDLHQGAVDPGPGGSHDAHALAGRTADRLEQIGGGGLAVRAGHAEATERTRRVPVDRGCRRTERDPHVGDFGLDDTQVESPLDDERDRACGDGGWGVDVAVGARTDHAREARSRTYTTTVVHHVHDVDARIAAVREHLDVRQELLQLHARVPLTLLIGTGLRVPVGRGAALMTTRAPARRQGRTA